MNIKYQVVIRHIFLIPDFNVLNLVFQKITLLY